VCGDDKYTGKHYDHRRGWVEAQTLELTDVFAIDVAAYAFFTKEREQSFACRTLYRHRDSE